MEASLAPDCFGLCSRAQHPAKKVLACPESWVDPCTQMKHERSIPRSTPGLRWSVGDGSGLKWRRYGMISSRRRASRAEPARTESADLGDVQLSSATLERDSAALVTSANQLHRISRRIWSASKTGESKQIAKCVDPGEAPTDLEIMLGNVMSFNDLHLRQCFNSDVYLSEIEQQAVRLGISGMRRANGMLLAQPYCLTGLARP